MTAAGFNPAELSFPAAHVARGHALHLLTEADQAIERLVGGRSDDVEAVHDYRVALRRLRSWLRSFGRTMGVRSKINHRIARRAAASASARDTEVCLALMRTYAEELPAVPRSVLNRHLAVEEQRILEGRQALVRTAPDGWVGDREKILTALVQGGNGAATEPFIGVFADVMQRAAERLDRRMREQSTPEEMHRTRIEVKNLRYLIEPAQGVMLAASGIVTRLRELQDTHGSLNDHEVLLRYLGDAISAVAEQQATAMYQISSDDDYEPAAYAALRRSDPAPALAAITRIVASRHRELFESLLAAAERHEGFRPSVLAMFDPPAAIGDRALAS